MSHYFLHLLYLRGKAAVQTQICPPSQSTVLEFGEEPAAYSLPLFCQFVKCAKAAVRLISSVGVLQSYIALF